MKGKYAGLLGAMMVFVMTPVHAANRVYGLAGVKVPVTDVTRATAFYTRYAGYREDRRYAPYELVLLPKAGPGASIVMYDLNKAPAEDRPGRGFVLVYVDDVEALVRQLHADGIAGVGRIIRAPAAKLVIAHDPDGNIVEFIQMD